MKASDYLERVEECPELQFNESRDQRCSTDILRYQKSRHAPARAAHLVLSKQTPYNRHASVVKQLIDYAILSVGLDYIRSNRGASPASIN